MAYDPMKGFREAATTYAGPEPSMPTPNRPFDRSKAEPWVMGTEVGPPKELANTVGPPTDADRAAWAKAQEAFARPKQTTDPFNKTLVQAAQAFLPGKAAFALMPEQEKQRQMDVAGRYPLAPGSGSPGAFTDSDVGAVAPLEPRPAPAPAPLEARPLPVTPKLTPLGNGYGVTGDNTSGRAGYTNKTYYDPAGNVVASGLSSATGGGGFVGASTDAQAAKALQDRAEQNAAAQFNIDNMKHAANAERDLRAARLGVSRGVLDRIEGRNDTAAAMADSAAQSAIPDHWFDPLSLPGDSFQDTRGRKAEYDRAVDQALNGDSRQQKGAQVALQGLHGIVTANQNARAADRERESATATVGNERLKALLAQQERAVDNARADRSVALQERQYLAQQEQNQFNRDHTAAQFDRQGREDRMKLGEGKQKQVTEDAKKFMDLFNGKVELPKVLQYGQQMLPALTQWDPRAAQRIRDGIPTYEDLLLMKSGMDSGQDPTTLLNPFSWFSDAPTPSQVVDRMYSK